jgi:hypothetical protein
MENKLNKLEKLTAIRDTLKCRENYVFCWNDQEPYLKAKKKRKKIEKKIFKILQKIFKIC